MAFTNPFKPQGNTALIAPTTTASAAIQPSTASIATFRLNNTSTNPVWVAYGSSTIVATLPTTTTAANAFPMAAGGIETFDFTPNCYVSAITTVGTGQLALTPGLGS